MHPAKPNHRSRPIGLLLLVAGMFFLSLSGAVCIPKKKKTDSPLAHIQLPPGFAIEVYAEGVTNARSMCMGDRGTLFVGTRSKGDVYALQDLDHDFVADTMYTIATDLFMPNGVAFRDGALYVAEVNRVLRWDQIEDRLGTPGEPVVANDSFPSESHHGWKYIAFGPDDKLYVPVGAPCNICERLDDLRFSTMMRMNPDGSELEVYASGIRNSVGFAWHPDSRELYFTDNGRDWLGDDAPNDELNHAPKAGMHFGYPYCHAGDIPDPKLGEGHTCSSYTPPLQKLGPHVAALGMKFYTGKMFPEAYRNRIFICEHGSWNRKDPLGYRITTVKLEGGKAVSYEVFAEGWLQGNKVTGRPVDVLQLADGSMLVSDDTGDRIYRITYGK